MRFVDVAADLRGLIGKELQSIRKGSEIRLTEFRSQENRVLVCPVAGGKEVSRPLSELEKIWDALCSSPAVHVDTVLKGSGSSRSQPETILANLPYIEWLVVGGKKHLARVRRPSHPIGTLRKMDPLQADEVRAALGSRVSDSSATVMVVTDDIAAATGALSEFTGSPPTVLEKGVYTVTCEGLNIIVVSAGQLLSPIPPGTYVVLGNLPTPEHCVRSQMRAIAGGGLNALLVVGDR